MNCILAGFGSDGAGNIEVKKGGLRTENETRRKVLERQSQPINSTSVVALLISYLYDVHFLLLPLTSDNELLQDFLMLASYHIFDNTQPAAHHSYHQ